METQPKSMPGIAMQSMPANTPMLPSKTLDKVSECWGGDYKGAGCVKVFPKHGELEAGYSEPCHHYSFPETTGFESTDSEIRSLTGKLVPIEFLYKKPDGTVVPGIDRQHIVQAVLHSIQQLNCVFDCEENKNSIFHLEKALEWMTKRDRDRIARKVQGQHTK